MSARIRTQYFDSRFVYIWKVVYIQKTKLRVAITNILRNWRSNSVFLDLILLRFTPVASYTFYCPSWRSTANSLSATLSCTCFWIFLPSGIQSGKETDVGRQRLNWVLESLFTFGLLVFRTKQGAWHKRIKLMKVSDFPSTRTTNSVRLILGSQKGNNFTRTALQESHQTTSFALRPETSSCCNMIPRRTKFKGRDHGYAHARRLSLRNKFVRSTLNSKSPLLMESLKILCFIPTSATLAGLVILR